MAGDTPPMRLSKANRRAARKAAARRRAQKQRILQWSGIAAVVAVILVAGLIYLNRDEPAAGEVAFNEYVTEGRFLGNPDAPVNIVIYSDFQCPFCAQFDERDFPPLVENEVASGDVRVEWRPMPIISSMVNIPLDSPGNESVRAAEAAICAADQERFWPYSDALYEARDGENAGVFADDRLVAVAGEVNLDEQVFAECLASDEKHDDVMELYDDGSERGIAATPTFLINDRIVRYTAGGYDDLKREIAATLAQEVGHQG